MTQLTHAEAVKRSGEAVMDFMIRHRVVSFVAVWNGQLIDQSSSSPVMDMVHCAHRAIAGRTALGLLIDEPRTTRDAERDAIVRTIVSRLVADPENVERLVDGITDLNHDFLLRHRWVIRQVAELLMADEHLSQQDLDNVMTDMVAHEEQHWTWAVAGQAVATHQCNGTLEELVVEPQHPGLPAGVCLYTLPQSDSLVTAARVRSERLLHPRYSRKIAGLAARHDRMLYQYARGGVDQNTLLRWKVAQRKTMDALAGGISLAHDKEFCQQVESMLVVSFAGDVAEQIALGDVLIDIGQLDERMTYAAWIASDPTEASQILTRTQTQAEIVVRTRWTAVCSVADALFRSKGSLSGGDAHQVIQRSGTSESALMVA